MGEGWGFNRHAVVPGRSCCKADYELTPLGERESFTEADTSLGGRSGCQPGREVRAPETELGVRLKRQERVSSQGRECGVRKQMTAEDKALGDTHSWGAGRERIQKKTEQLENWGGGPTLFQGCPTSVPPFSPISRARLG